MTGDDVGLEILRQDVAELVASRTTECQDFVSTFLVLYSCMPSTVDQPGPRSLIRSLSTGGDIVFSGAKIMPAGLMILEQHAGLIAQSVQQPPSCWTPR